MARGKQPLCAGPKGDWSSALGCTASQPQTWALCLVFWCEIACSLISEYGGSADADRICCRVVSALEVGAFPAHAPPWGDAELLACGTGCACHTRAWVVDDHRLRTKRSRPPDQSWQEQVRPCDGGHLPKVEGGFEQLHLHQGPPATAQRPHLAQNLLL